MHGCVRASMSSVQYCRFSSSHFFLFLCTIICFLALLPFIPSLPPFKKIPVSTHFCLHQLTPTFSPYLFILHPPQTPRGLAFLLFLCSHCPAHSPCRIQSAVCRLKCGEIQTTLSLSSPVTFLSALCMTGRSRGIEQNTSTSFAPKLFAFYH